MSRAKKPAIPQTPKEGEPRMRFDATVKESLEIITGRRGTAITALSPTATTAEIIAKVNEIIEVLQ